MQNSNAQNAGGVFPPMVNEGHKAAEYRITQDPQTNAVVQRVHYQHSLNDTVMLRGVVQGRDRSNDDFDFSFAQAEAFVQFKEDCDIWCYGMRFDARISGDNAPNKIGVHFTNQFHLYENLHARLVGLSFKDFGENAQNGLNIQTRANLLYMPQNPRIVSAGIEMYNNYGQSDDFNDFEDQSHQIGPVATWNIAPTLNITTSALFGLTHNSPDSALRFWMTKGF